MSKKRKKFFFFAFISQIVCCIKDNEKKNKKIIYSDKSLFLRCKNNQKFPFGANQCGATSLRKLLN